MNDLIILVAFAFAFLGLALTILRRDMMCGMFTFGLMVYTLPSLIGYRYFPLLSEALGAYFGRQIYYKSLAFITLSLIAYGVAFHLVHRPLVGSKRYRLLVQVNENRRAVGLAAATLLTIWMALTLPRIYSQIDYGRSPQIPNFTYALAFKNLPPIIVLLISFVMFHAKTVFERTAAWILSGTLTALFLVTAIKSSNRTDILSLTLGLTCIVLGPLLIDKEWRMKLTLNSRLVRRAALAISLTTVSLILMFQIRENRQYSAGLFIPLYIKILYNDYYAPAHILFAAIQFKYVEPILVLKSNIANALQVGGLLDVPYLQTEIGNRLIPGSSTRSSGFAMHIFAEGFLAFGNLGFLYNGIVPVIMLALWRRLARSDDVQYNTLVAALCLMLITNIVRSGNFLTFRLYLFTLLPLLSTYRFIAGIQLVPEKQRQ